MLILKVPIPPCTCLRPCSDVMLTHVNTQVQHNEIGDLLLVCYLPIHSTCSVSVRQRILHSHNISTHTIRIVWLFWARALSDRLFTRSIMLTRDFIPTSVTSCTPNGLEFLVLTLMCFHSNLIYLSIFIPSIRFTDFSTFLRTSFALRSRLCISLQTIMFYVSPRIELRTSGVWRYNR